MYPSENGYSSAIIIIVCTLHCQSSHQAIIIIVCTLQKMVNLHIKQ